MLRKLPNHCDPNHSGPACCASEMGQLVSTGELACRHAIAEFGRGTTRELDGAHSTPASLARSVKNLTCRLSPVSVASLRAGRCALGSWSPGEARLPLSTTAAGCLCVGEVCVGKLSAVSAPTLFPDVPSRAPLHRAGAEAAQRAAAAAASKPVPEAADALRQVTGGLADLAGGTVSSALIWLAAQSEVHSL